MSERSKIIIDLKGSTKSSLYISYLTFEEADPKSKISDLVWNSATTYQKIWIQQNKRKEDKNGAKRAIPKQMQSNFNYYCWSGLNCVRVSLNQKVSNWNNCFCYPVVRTTLQFGSDRMKSEGFVRESPPSNLLSSQLIGIVVLIHIWQKKSSCRTPIRGYLQLIWLFHFARFLEVPHPIGCSLRYSHPPSLEITFSRSFSPNRSEIFVPRSQIKWNPN